MSAAQLQEDIDREFAKALAASQEHPDSRNTPARWEEAISYYMSQQQPKARSKGKVVFNCVIDVSGSMEGTKLTSVKLGLCAVVSSLTDDDVINISSFSDKRKSVTGGFKSVGHIRSILSRLLATVQTEGATACYDAAAQGVLALREEEARQTREESDVSENKYVLLLLTDGEDTSSACTAESVTRYLTVPGISRFMFLLVAVEMQPAEERVFEPWLEYEHCKQISVSIRTGAKLVQIFREALMNRILYSDAKSSRFYHKNTSTGTIFDESKAGVSLSSAARRRGGDSSPARCRDHSTGYTRSTRSRSPSLRARPDRTNTSTSGCPYDPPPRSVSPVPGSYVGNSSSTPKEFICPISKEIMADPVLCEDGHTYDKVSIEKWFSKSYLAKSPLTGLPLASKSLVPNHALRSLIQSMNLQQQQINIWDIN